MNDSLLLADYTARFAAWTKLMDDGDQPADDTYYFEYILPAILPVMRARSGDLPTYDALISLLGFTPETTVVACKMLHPASLVVNHMPETAGFLEVVRDRSGIPLASFHHEVSDFQSRLFRKTAAGASITARATKSRRRFSCQGTSAAESRKRRKRRASCRRLPSPSHALPIPRPTSAGRNGNHLG
jgi:hypothetical protein